MNTITRIAPDVSHLEPSDLVVNPDEHSPLLTEDENMEYFELVDEECECDGYHHGLCGCANKYLQIVDKLIKAGVKKWCNDRLLVLTKLRIPPKETSSKKLIKPKSVKQSKSDLPQCIARTYTKMLSPSVQCSARASHLDSQCCGKHHKLWLESPKALTLVTRDGVTYKKGLWYGTIYDFQEGMESEGILPCIVTDPTTGRKRCFCIWGDDKTSEYIASQGFNPKRTDKRCDLRYSDHFSD